MASVNFDKVLDEVGVCGRYQVRMVALISLPLMYSAMFGLNFYFTKIAIDQRCVVPECDDKKNPTYFTPWVNNSIPFDSKRERPSQCERYASVEPRNSNSSDNDTCPAEWFDDKKKIECEKYVFKDPDITIETQWINACINNHIMKLELIGILRNLAMFFGNGMTGIIQDRIGRRYGLVIVLLISSFLGMMKSFSANYEMYLIFEFMGSMLASGIYSAGFILGLEMVGQRNRVLVAMLMSAFYPAGEVLLGGIALMLRHWRDLLRAIYIPPMFFIAYLWLIPESVRWLSCKGQVRQARRGLLIMAEENGVKLNDVQLKDMIVEQAGSFKEIFKSKRLMLRFLVNGVCWFLCSLVYFSYTLDAFSVGADPYTDFIYMALVEIPAIFTAYLMLLCMGRRMVMVTTLAVTGVNIIVSILVPEDIPWLDLTVFVAGKFVITIAFNVLFLFTAEMFPTPHRGLMVGLSEVISRLAAIFAAMTTFFADFSDWKPLLCIGLVCLMAAALMFLLPETRHSRLPDTIEEAENIGKKPPLVPEPLFPEQPSEE